MQCRLNCKGVCNAATACNGVQPFSEPRGQAEAVSNAFSISQWRSTPSQSTSTEVRLQIGSIQQVTSSRRSCCESDQIRPEDGQLLQQDRLHRCLRVLVRFIQRSLPRVPQLLLRIQALGAQVQRSALSAQVGFGGGESRLLENEAARSQRVLIFDQRTKRLFFCRFGDLPPAHAPRVHQPAHRTQYSLLQYATPSRHKFAPPHKSGVRQSSCGA
jgi:hypothetical protein